jgi:antirestriction protein ArdC/3'-phosphoadenosine 5'-phosphosulfate sulfotransferase (PAPS reductase)/FAD synthetase
MMKHRSGKPFTDRRDHYQEVTDKIIAALEAGTRPWRQPWKSGSPGMPINATTGRPYHGINVLLLAMTSFALGGDPRFCSYKQASDRGWQVRKGGRGTTVFFFKRMLVEDRNAAPDAEDRTKAIPILRAYTVFNGSQIEGIPAYVAPDIVDAPWRRQEAADIILTNSQAVIRLGGDRAFYSPSLDFIQLPQPGSFESPEAFSSTALHEAAHYADLRIMPHDGRKGGSRQEMLRENAPTARIHYETPTGTRIAGGNGPTNTRLRFPQVSADLSVRWCSAYLKIMVSDALIRGNDRFLGRRTLVVTGERAEESPARARYASFEPHRTDTRTGTRRRRHVDHWRPVHHWREREVWEALRRRGVVPHVGYQLGWGRLSCMACIFMSADQAASLRFMAPTVFDSLASYERRFGFTVKRGLSLHALADRGRPYDQVLNRSDLVQLALSDTWDRPIRVAPRSWRPPAGAFGDKAGPS